MSLTNEILPGDPLDGTKVRANFVDLGTMVNANAVGNEQIEPGSIDTRHLSGTWTSNVGMTANGPTALGGRLQIGTTVTVSSVNAMPYEIIAGVSVIPAAIPWSVVFDVEVDGSIYQTITVGGQQNDRQHILIPLGQISVGASDDIKLFGTLVAGPATWDKASLSIVSALR